MTDLPYVRIHGKVYLTRAEFDAVIADAKRLAMIASTGLEPARPLELLAVRILEDAGKLR